jgi:parallel beta-helix repeat protein
MTQGFQRFTNRYVNVLVALIGLVVVSSILLYSGCGMTSNRTSIPNPTPTPDRTAPTSVITSPTSGATVSAGTAVSVTGTASDTGGTVARVEVSVDGGATYSATTGTTAWSFSWTPTTPGQATLRSRAVDTSGNTQDPPAQITVTVRTPITIRVPSDQPTIQAAIDVANIGDTVLVAPGTYAENINFRGKAITVRSESGPQDTIIDGRNAGSVVSFISGEGRNSTINGFTLQNGNAIEGGGVKVQGSSPTITNNVIRNNRGCSRGAGIGIDSGSPLIRLNTITGNGNNLCSGGEGGGISIGGASSVEILDNVISDNGMNSSFGGGIYMLSSSGPIIKRNVIKGNSALETLGEPLEAQGGGIYMAYSDALIVQNLITGNRAAEGGGIFCSGPEAYGHPILVNNTIADNDATSNGSGIFVYEPNALTELTNKVIVANPGQTGLYCSPLFEQNPPIIRFNNIFSGGGMAYGGNCPDMTGTNGNISADPRFTNPTQGDYHLQQGSPSIDAGDNSTPNLSDKDLDGHPRILDGDGNGTAIVDMGVYEFLAPSSFKIGLQLDRRNWMRLESQVSFYDSVGGRFPHATRFFVGGITAGYQFTGKVSK